MDSAIKDATNTPPQAEQIGRAIDRFEQSSAFAAGTLTSKATSTIDTKALESKGTLPTLNIDSGTAICDTTYTKADWDKEQLSVSKSLAKVDEILARRDLEGFKGYFADPKLSPEVREKFLEKHGLDKIERAFGNDSTIFPSDTDVQDAMQYVKFGRNDILTKIDRQRTLWGLDRSGLVSALRETSPEEQAKFNSGKNIVNSGHPAITNEQIKAVNFYHEVHYALERASGYKNWDSGTVDRKEVEYWERLIKKPPTPDKDPLDLCQLQKTAVKASQQRIFEEQVQKEQERLDEQDRLDDVRQRLLDNIPELVKRAAAEGFRSVVVLDLDDTRNYDSMSYPMRRVPDWQTRGDYYSSREEEAGSMEPPKAELSEWQKTVYDQIKAYGLEPSIELGQDRSIPRYDSPFAGYGSQSGYRWQLIARW